MEEFKAQLFRALNIESLTVVRRVCGRGEGMVQRELGDNDEKI